MDDAPQKRAEPLHYFLFFCVNIRVLDKGHARHAGKEAEIAKACMVDAWDGPERVRDDQVWWLLDCVMIRSYYVV